MLNLEVLELLDETIERELPDLAKQGVRTRFLGRRDRIDPAIQEQMRALEDETASLDTLALWIAFDYGGRAELIEAIIENPEAKRALYGTVEPNLKPDAFLTTNTSSIPITARYAVQRARSRRYALSVLEDTPRSTSRWVSQARAERSTAFSRGPPTARGA